MFDTSCILFSSKDKKHNVKLPGELTCELSYFLGLLVGDGYVRHRLLNNDYMTSLDGNKVELGWYLEKLKPLVIELFNKSPSVRLTQTTVQLSLHSKAIFFFLTKVCGLIESPKQHCRIPDSVRNSSKETQYAFLRGLADTDGSFVVKKKEGRRYPVIDFATCSKELQADLVQMISRLGIANCSGVYHTTRLGTPTTRYYIQINGVQRTEKWMDLIGFNCPTKRTKYENWKKESPA